MRNKKEIVSLNTVKFETVDGMSLDERLEQLTSKELKAVKAGDGCQWMDYYGCDTMCNGVNAYYCPDKKPDDWCSTHGDCGGYCSFECGGTYEGGLGCIYYDICFIMT